MVNLNDLANKITIEEGGKRILNVGDVKEVMRRLLTKMARMTVLEVAEILRKYK